MPQFKRNLFPKSLDENLSDYPQETTLHGVKYLANRSRPLADRIFWIIIFSLSISCLSYFIYKIARTWIENPVMITDRNLPTKVYEIPFPAVTICPQIKIKLDKFDFSNLEDDIKQFDNYSDFTSNDFGKKFIMASQICRREFRKHIQPKIQDSKAFEDASGLGILPDDWINTLHDMSPKLDEVFDSCEMSSWNTDENFTQRSPKKNCERLFSTIVTNEGICFTFNAIQDILRMDSLQTNFQYHNITRSRDGWDPENGYTNANAYPYKGIVKGSPNRALGLKFVVNANLSDTSPFCFPSNVGYKLVLHSPSAYPQTYDNFIILAYGREYKIAAKPETIETNDDLRSFTPDERNCFFNDERKLQFYTYYNEENCELECYANYSARIHNGVPFSSPRDSNTTNCILPHKNFGWDLPEYVALFHEHSHLYGLPGDMDDVAGYVNCNCLPECNAILYGNTILKSNDDFSIEMTDEKSVDKNANIIQTTIEVIFNEPSFIGQKRVRMYTFETMISDFGGLLGLFMGGSVLSLFELIYFLTIRNCFKPKEDLGDLYAQTN